MWCLHLLTNLSAKKTISFVFELHGSHGIFPCFWQLEVFVLPSLMTVTMDPPIFYSKAEFIETVRMDKPLHKFPFYL
jgi:hypothetical protein